LEAEDVSGERTVLFNNFFLNKCAAIIIIKLTTVKSMSDVERGCQPAERIFTEDDREIENEEITNNAATGPRKFDGLERGENASEGYGTLRDLLADGGAYARERLSGVYGLSRTEDKAGEELEFEESDVEEVNEALDGQEVSESLEGADELLEPEEEEEGKHRNIVFGMLKNERRRAVLRYMDEFEDETPVALGTLAEEIAAYEQEKTVEELNTAERKRVYVALYQRHLDDLDENGFVEYNDDRGLVEQGPDFEFVTPYIEDEFRADDERIYLENGIIGQAIEKISSYKP